MSAYISINNYLDHHNHIEYNKGKGKYNKYVFDLLDNKIINNSNKIKLNQNSELTLIEYKEQY